MTFKAEKPLPNETDNYYCRFILFEETYGSPNDARLRMDRLREISPEAPVEDRHNSPLRAGFVVDRTVYILQTDAAIFLPEVQRLAKLLAASRTVQS